ncbi:histidine phosphatase family protein [Kitasatospora sp. NBC_01539]|uniref:histidine phosphatase family protein n=1 Tax=Kitasatospora sp. NBC_01539 TaxID=2903577 RepID=UPI0038601DC6
MSESARTARFDDGRPLDALGLRTATAARGTLRPAGRVLRSPTPRCRQTADALGLSPHADDEPALAPCAMGRWRGRTLDEVAAAEPDAVGRWLTDPDAAPHGGEPLRSLLDRVAGWLDALALRDGGSDGDGPARLIAVVEPEVVRAAALHALGAPASAFRRLDVAPLTATEFSGRAGRWNVRCGTPLGGPAGQGDLAHPGHRAQDPGAAPLPAPQG